MLIRACGVSSIVYSMMRSTTVVLYTARRGWPITER